MNLDDAKDGDLIKLTSGEESITGHIKTFNGVTCICVPGFSVPLDNVRGRGYQAELIKSARPSWADIPGVHILAGDSYSLRICCSDGKYYQPASQYGFTYDELIKSYDKVTRVTLEKD